MTLEREPLLGAIAFLWIGFVCAISFMEAWLKFTAAGVTLTTGLAIGQVVFAALNRVEVVLGGAMIMLLISKNTKQILSEWMFLVTVFILIIQTVYILPRLSDRIELYLSGETPASSYLHQVYMLMEIIKVSALALFGIKHLNYGNK